MRPPTPDQVDVVHCKYSGVQTISLRKCLISHNVKEYRSFVDGHVGLFLLEGNGLSSAAKPLLVNLEYHRRCHLSEDVSTLWSQELASMKSLDVALVKTPYLLLIPRIAGSMAWLLYVTLCMSDFYCENPTRSGVRTHADIRPLDLKSNALTTRPSW